MSTFGSFLLERGLIDAEALDEATQSTVLYGGRLGTSLVEAGVLGVDELDAALARYHGIEPPDAAWLAEPNAAARTKLSPELVKRHRAFPLQLDKRTLHVGMLDPANEGALDDLSFASGCLIAAHPISECRFVDLLHRVYGVQPSHRFVNLMAEARLARKHREERAAAEARSADPAQTQREDLGLLPLAADHELIDEAAFEELQAERALASGETRREVAESGREAAKLAAAEGAANAATATEATPAAAEAPAASSGARPAAPPSGASEPPLLELEDDVDLLRPAPREVAALEGRVASTSSRDEMIDAALRVAGAHVESAALFILRGAVASGARAYTGGELREIEAVMLPLAEGSALARAAAEGEAWAGAAPHELDRRLLKALGAQEGTSLVVVPVAIRRRSVNLLLGHNAGSPVAATATAALAALGDLLAAGYERLILQQKQSPPKG